MPGRAPLRATVRHEGRGPAQGPGHEVGLNPPHPRRSGPDEHTVSALSVNRTLSISLTGRGDTIWAPISGSPYVPITPVYRQILADLRGLIASGELRPGDKLPTTRDLAKKYEAATSTVRAAIMVMLETGELVGRQGVGVFVAGSANKAE